MVCDVQKLCSYIENENIVQVVLFNIGYEPAGLTVHPPPE